MNWTKNTRVEEIHDSEVMVISRLNFFSHIENTFALARQTLGYIKWLSRGRFHMSTLLLLYTACIQNWSNGFCTSPLLWSRSVWKYIASVCTRLVQRYVEYWSLGYVRLTIEFAAAIWDQSLNRSNNDFSCIFWVTVFADLRSDLPHILRFAIFYTFNHSKHVDWFSNLC